jgi:hypothetical protein
MYCAGNVSATVANSAPFGDPHRKALSPLDFVPEWQKRATQSQAQDLDDMVEVLTAVFQCGPNKPGRA